MTFDVVKMRHSSVVARFQRARLNNWIDFYWEPSALETRPYRGLTWKSPATAGRRRDPGALQIFRAFQQRF